MKHSFKEAFQLLNKYSRKSIFYTYLKKLFILVFIPLIVVLSIVFYFNRLTINNEISYSASSAMESAYISGENILKEISANHINLTENEYILLFMNYPKEDFFKFGNLFSAKVLELLKTPTLTSNNIYSISVYSLRNGYIMSNTGGGFAEVQPYKPWYDYYLKTHFANFIISSDEENSVFVSLGCYSNENLIGIITFEIKQSTLKKSLLCNSDSEKNQFYIVDKNDAIIYGTSSSKEDLEFAQKYLNEKNTYYKRNKRIVLKKTFETKPDVSLLYVNDLKNNNNAAAPINILFLVCVVICLIAPLLISFYVSLNFYKSIMEIISVLNVGESENKSEVDEFTFISSHIIELLDKNANAEAELMKRTAAFKQAQSVAYQSQLSPHFLFNTLNIISLTSRVMFKGSNKIEKIVSLLSELLAAAINTKDYIVTVNEEISYAKTYIEIQRIRYSDTFDVIWDIDEDLLSVKTIKLILQPLIENAFFHGFSTLEDKRGTLCITAKSLNDNDMCFCIADNGEKIDNARLKEIRENLEKDDLLHKNHIGLSNVNMRIKTVFGEAYGVKIHSDNKGTRIYITFPKK